MGQTGFDDKTIDWYIKNDKPLPDWLMSQPPVVRGDEFYMRAFSELSSCRMFGEVIGPIPWRDIVAYGSHRGLDSGMIRVFEVVIRELDEAYLKDQREDKKKRVKK